MLVKHCVQLVYDQNMKCMVQETDCKPCSSLHAVYPTSAAASSVASKNDTICSTSRFSSS